MVDQAGLERLISAEGLAGQRPFTHLALRRDQLQQAQHLHREHAHLDFGQAEHHVVDGHRHVGHAQQPHAAGHVA
jgi:hypothetical protein